MRTAFTPTWVALVLLSMMRGVVGGAVSGLINVTPSESSPESELTEVCRRLDIDLKGASLAPQVKATAENYEPGKELLQVFVPGGYKSTNPHGLLVWVGVGPLSPSWLDVFSRHNLLAVSAIAKSPAHGLAHVRLPLDALLYMQRTYAVDENRVFVAGFSAGGGIAASLVCGYPDRFRGAYLIMGGRFCVAHRAEAGNYEPTLQLLTPAWKKPIAEVSGRLSVVLLRAQGDSLYSPKEDLAQYHSLLLDGFQHVKLIVTPGGHQPPDAFWFEQGIKALISPESQVASTEPLRPVALGDAGQAQRLLATARLLLERRLSPQLDAPARERFQKTSREQARAYLERIIAQYPTTGAATRARLMLADLNSRPASSSTPPRQ